MLTDRIKQFWSMVNICLSEFHYYIYIEKIDNQKKSQFQTRNKMQLWCFNLFNFFHGNRLHISCSFTSFLQASLVSHPFFKLPSLLLLPFSFLLPWNSFKMWLEPLMVSCFLIFLEPVSPSMEGELSFSSLFLPLIYPRWAFVIKHPIKCCLACIPWV